MWAAFAMVFGVLWGGLFGEFVCCRVAREFAFGVFVGIEFELVGLSYVFFCGLFVLGWLVGFIV